MLKLCCHKGRLEAGVDEAGRGALAGPVVAAAVILPDDFTNDILNDSKKLTEKQRNLLREIIEKEAIAYSIGVVSNQRIDEINVLQATYEAMHMAISTLGKIPECLAIDGNRFNRYKNIPHSTIVKGDGKYMNIAAASVLAKTERDRLMIAASGDFPEYGWDRNKGYGTKEHVTALGQFGMCTLHRRSFHLKRQLQLDL